MRISSIDFLNGLRINQQYFFKTLKKIGVQGRYVFTSEDLTVIRDRFPVKTYRSNQIVERAYELLGNNSHVAKV